MPDLWHGGWLGTQLESFTYALRTQVLVGCAKLVPAPNTKAECCPWAAARGMPDFKPLLLPIRIPNPGAVESYYAQGVAQIAEIRVAHPEIPHGWWRRWQPGRSGSHLAGDGTLAPTPLVTDVPRRLQKLSPPWRRQCLMFREWWRPVLTSTAYFHLLPNGQTIGQLLHGYGVIACADVKGFQIWQRCIASRAAHLALHNRDAAAKPAASRCFCHLLSPCLCSMPARWPAWLQTELVHWSV